MLLLIQYAILRTTSPNICAFYAILGSKKCTAKITSMCHPKNRCILISMLIWEMQIKSACLNMQFYIFSPHKQQLEFLPSSRAVCLQGM